MILYRNVGNTRLSSINNSYSLLIKIILNVQIKPTLNVRLHVERAVKDLLAVSFLFFDDTIDLILESIICWKDGDKIQRGK